MTREQCARRTTAAGAASITAVLTALALTGCTTADPGDGTSTTAGGATTTAAAPPASAPASSAPAATIDGEPVDAVAADLSVRLADALSSAGAEFGDVGVDLLQLQADHVSLYFVDPGEPATRNRSQARDSIWSAPLGTPRPDTAAPLPLDAVDPDVLRAAVESAPALLGVDRARLSHVSVSPDGSGQTEYLVALATADSLGRATFGPDGRVREIRPPG